jgi:hypothetical protein
MGLKPEVSLGVGLATAAVVYGVYSNATPTIADIRSGASGDNTIDGTRKAAAWLSAAVVAGISLIARDPTVFVLGGSMVVGLDWLHRHANEVNPDTGRATLPGGISRTLVVDDPTALGVAG